MNIFEEIGGLSEIIFLLGFVIIAPIAEHYYVLRAIAKFYVVKESLNDQRNEKKYLDESTRQINPLTTLKKLKS